MMMTPIIDDDGRILLPLCAVRGGAERQTKSLTGTGTEREPNRDGMRIGRTDEEE